MDGCTGETVTTYIEPLVGLTRHPSAICFDDSYDALLDRGYLILGATSAACEGAAARMTPPHPLPASRALFRTERTRLLLFDLGASLYSSGPGGDSQKWFNDAFNRHDFPVTE
jgi:hypothetical protein